MPKTVMIVEDDEMLASNIREHLERYGWKVDVCASAEQALSMPERVRPRIVVTDYLLPGKTGLHLLKQFIAANSRTKVVMITAHGDEELAVAAMRAGAYDFLGKPLALRNLISVLDGALDKVDDRRAGLNDATRRSVDRHGLESIVGQAPAMMALKAKLGRLLDAERDLEQGDQPAVLITGETGTGKGLVARTLHVDGLRRDAPFVELNCASIPINLLESELFGHERGAFTDAKERKAGLVEAAEGGTLFLDEIGELDFSIQAKLLKLLEERTVRRIGGTHERKVDVRIISATNQDLEKMVRAGRFRSDLLFRLRIMSVHMPPLRQRAEDVLPLARLFLQTYRDRYGRPGLGFTADTERTLLAYHWPVNVRELKNAIEQAVLLTRGDAILPGNLTLCLQQLHDSEAGESGSTTCIRGRRANLDRLNRDRIKAAINQTGWNIAQAARLLGISRDTLRYRVRKYGLNSGIRAGQLRSKGEEE
jgi:DNA-binding NtrC family response regulator